MGVAIFETRLRWRVGVPLLSPHETRPSIAAGQRRFHVSTSSSAFFPRVVVI